MRARASRGGGQLQHRKLPSLSRPTRIRWSRSFNDQPPARGRRQGLIEAYTRHVPLWTVCRSYTSTSHLPSPFLSRLTLLRTCRDRSWGRLQRGRGRFLDRTARFTGTWRHLHWGHLLRGIPMGSLHGFSSWLGAIYLVVPQLMAAPTLFVGTLLSLLCSWLLLLLLPLACPRLWTRRLWRRHRRQNNSVGQPRRYCPSTNYLDRGPPQLSPTLRHRIPVRLTLARAQGTGSLRPGSPLLVEFLATRTHRL